MKSHLTKGRIEHLMDCVYEAHNSKLCQIVGDHLDGNVSCDRAHVISCILTEYNGKLLQIQCRGLRDRRLQLLINSLKKRQCRHYNDNLILDISHCRVAHQSFSSLVQLLSTNPIVELNINRMDFQSSSDMDSFYPNSNVASAHLSDIQLLSQVFTSSNTLSVLDISGTDIGPEGAACLAEMRNVLIRDLRMKRCNLGPTGADKIGEMLYHNNSIVSIDLSSNNIEDSGVERLVYHLNKKNKLRHLNLENNEITAVGAYHLRRLIATDHRTLTSIELSRNPLKDEGVHVILSSLTVTMENVGLRRVQMTASSCSVISASLDKIKKISIDLHYDDCEVISLANTTVLKQLELFITSDSANHKMLSAIRQSDNIETLILDYCFIKGWVADITKLLKCSKTITQLTVICYEQPPQDDILLIADSLTVNTSVRQFNYDNGYMDLTKTLNFLEHLKQAYTVEKVTLRVLYEAYYNQFLGDVEKCVQQINHIRSTKGVANLLKVAIL